MNYQAALCPICSQRTTPKFRPFCSAECSNLDLDRVRGELIAGLEQLAETLLGAPSIRKPRTWRWGKQGSLVLELHGRKRGAWHDKEGEQGGGPFHLIARARSCSMGEAIAFARNWTGGTPNAGVDYKAEQAARQAERDRKAREHAAEDAADAAQRVGVAGQMWAKATPIHGTVAERYLVDERRIPASSSWPDVVRFHAPTRSLIVGATLADGRLQAVQRVRLTVDAGKMPGTPENPTKVTNGVLAGAAVRLPGDPLGPLLIAEGPETGLSLWAATGHETWIALGGVAGVELPAGRPVVVCRDDDPKHSPGDKKMTRAIETWRTVGHQFGVATPWPFRAYDRTDFNDTLKVDGAAGIRRRIEVARNPGGGAPTRLPIRQVRDHLRVAVGGFFDAVRGYDAARRALPPEPEPETELLDWGEVLDIPVPKPAVPVIIPVHAIRMDLGTGKTVRSIAEAARLLTEMRAVGDKRSGVFAVPTHKLGDEQAAVFEVQARHTGLTAAVWRGMAAPDPDSPADLMCRNLEAVADAREALQNVQKTTCKRKLDDGTYAVCPFFEECGYQRQRVSRADLWIVAHEMVFGEKPTTFGKVAFLVVDEAVWADGLEGVHGRPAGLALDALAHLPPLPLDAEWAGRTERERLEFLRNRLLDVLRSAGDGPLTAEALYASDLTLANTGEAYALEWKQLVDAGMRPGMSREQRKEAARRAAGNAAIPRLARVWQAMTALLEDGGPQRSGWAALATQPTEDGLVKVLHLKGRRKVRAGWQVPTLLIDATLNIDLVRPYWPDVELTAELLADAPYQSVRQVVDRAYSKSAIEPLTEDQPGYSADEARRRLRGLRTVHAVLNREARRYGGAPVLVVAQKAVKEALPSIGPMAPCIEVAHHNAVAGRDEWRNVRALVVVGRTQPAPASVERMAEALSGRAVEHVDGWYARGDGVRHTAAAGVVAIEADRHPDPLVEAIRWQVCEGELLQIIGRGRGVNRDETTPLDVLVLTDAPLPLPVAATLQAADLAPSPDDLMMSAGGVVLENAADAAAAYPVLWGTRNAAKLALKRARAEAVDGPEVGVKPLLEYTYRGLTPTSAVTTRIAYQVAGAGKSPSVAWCDSVLVPNPAAWLESRLGPLAWCQGDRPDPPPSSSATMDQQPRPQLPDIPAEVAAVDGLTEAEARWGPLPDSYPDEFRSAEWDDEEQPEPMEPAVIAAVHDVEGRLHPAVAYPPSLSLAPHPGVAYFDALPIENLVRIRRRDLPDLVVSTIARPFRVLTADLAPVEQRPLLRVQGHDGAEEPDGVRPFIGWPQGSSDREKNSSGVTVALHSPVITSA